MRATLAPRWMTLAIVAGWLMVPSASPAQETTKPLLSEEIGRVIDKDGADAGQRRFDELYPAHKDEYQLDIPGFLNLATKYMQSGNNAAGQQVAQMMTVLAQNETAARTGMPAVDMSQKPEPKTEAKPKPHPLGAPRDDLDRFIGLYGDPDREDEHRTLWVSQSCDGYLVAGASWGDASPWYMRSITDTVFEATAFGGEKLRFEFPEQSLVHRLDYLPSPLPRIGPLPDGWENCIAPLETGHR